MQQENKKSRPPNSFFRAALILFNNKDSMDNKDNKGNTDSTGSLDKKRFLLTRQESRREMLLRHRKAGVQSLPSRHSRSRRQMAGVPRSQVFLHLLHSSLLLLIHSVTLAYARHKEVVTVLLNRSGYIIRL